MAEVKVAEAHQKLGEILMASEVLSPETLEKALAIQKKTGKLLGKILLDEGLVTGEELAQALALQKGLSLISLERTTINPHAAFLISENFARQYRVFAFDLKENELYLAMANPLDVRALDDLRVITGLKIKPYVAPDPEIEKAINQFFQEGAVEEVVKEAIQAAPEEEEEVALSELRAMVKEVPIVKLANRIIAQAVEEMASDIHLEPQRKEVAVRFRVDGVLHDVMKFPRKIQRALISRLKIMGDLDIAERRIPQSGSANLLVSGKAVDLRITTLPTGFGEMVSIRVLDKSQALFELEDLGFKKEILKKYKTAFSRAYGTILVTGPTGSGKSTTLYATLNKLNTPEQKIITIEDPVEYQLAGLTQVQVRPKAGLDFASALRSIVRCDPDIVMIGEIRDLETAQIAIRSALTGHLVLATLHTNDAPGAISRLTDMGLEAFFIPAVICVLAQRLARKLCPYCKEKYQEERKVLKECGFPLAPKEKPLLYRPKGCSKCLNTGYKGRIGLFELMMISEEISKMAIERKSADEIRKQTIKEGMKTLREDGFVKVKQGITSLEEIFRVVV